MSAYGYGQRAPTLTELYAAGPFVGVLQTGTSRLIGDPNLDKERLSQFDVGLKADYEKEIGVEAGHCYHCHTGRCPVGVTTQDPVLRKRLDPDAASERVYNFLHQLTRHRHDAEDLAQQTFIKAYHHLAGFDPRRPLINWLLTIARNNAINHFRDTKKAIGARTDQPKGQRQSPRRTPLLRDMACKTRLAP